jgi:Zn-dependent metalloprotease
MKYVFLGAALAAATATASTTTAHQPSVDASLAATASARAKELNFSLAPAAAGSRQRTWVKSPSIVNNKRVGGAAAATMSAPNATAVSALFHAELGALTGLLPGSNMVVDDVNSAADGSTYYHLHQLYQGLRVIGEDITVQVDSRSEVQAVLGGVVPIEALNLQPALNGDAAVRTAALVAAGREGINVPSLSRSAVRIEQAPALVIVAIAGMEPRLGWESRIRVTSAGNQAVSGRVLADADTGDLLGFENALQGSSMQKLWNMGGSCINTTTNFPFAADQTHVTLPTVNATLDDERLENWRAVLAQPMYVSTLWSTLRNVNTMFQDVFGRNSFDGRGGVLKIYNQVLMDNGSGVGCYGNNAFFEHVNSDSLIFGQGDATNVNTSLTADTAFHEYGHAVTKYTSGLLLYPNTESAALNEATSDMYAVIGKGWRTGTPGFNGIEFGTTPGHWLYNVGWKVGEPAAAMRTLSDPAVDNAYDFYANVAYARAYCQQSYCNPSIHYTYMGVPTLALYLAANGGVHPRGKTTLRVRTPVQMVRLSKYFYEANRTRAVPQNATFTQLRNAMQLQARGAGFSCDESSIALGFLAVGIDGIEPADPKACMSDAQKLIAAPTAQFQSADGPGFNDAVFDAALSTQPSDSIGLYLWEFGDGSVGYGRNISHNYVGPGNYRVRLRVYDTYGRLGEISKIINVF